MVLSPDGPPGCLFFWLVTYPTSMESNEENPSAVAVTKLADVMTYIAATSGTPVRLNRDVAPMTCHPPSNPANLLSSREHEVLLVFLRTGSITETAGRMYIAVNTVRTHVRALRQKYEASSATELICKAVGTFGR